jgi:hypothetical protein
VADPKKRIVVDGVDFPAVFLFPRILASASSALQPPRIVVALLMVVAIVGIGRAWDGLAAASIPPGGLDAPRMTSAEADAARREVQSVVGAAGVTVASGETREVLDAIAAAHRDGALDAEAHRRLADLVRSIAPSGPYAATAALVTGALGRAVRGVFTLRPAMIFDAGADVFLRLPAGLWRHDRTFAIAFLLVLLVVGAVGGGALSRMAACELAGQERLRVRDAFDFALGNWVKLVVAPALPLVLAGALAGVLVLGGLLLAPYVNVVGGLLYGAALVVALLIVLLLGGYAIGFFMLVPAVACENCDAADAQQRVYAYILNRPLHLLGYGVVALAGLSVGYAVTSFVGAAVINCAATLAGTIGDRPVLAGAGGAMMFDLSGSEAGAAPAVWHEAWTSATIAFWRRIVVDVVAAYVVSYFFTSATAVYLLMRRACDGQDVEEIWRPGLTPGTLAPIPRPRME